RHGIPGLAGQRRRVPHRAEGPRARDPRLHPRSGRSSHRGRPDHVTGTGPGRIRIEPVTPEQAEALSVSDAEFTRRFAVPVEAGWAGFPEALPIIIIIAAAHQGGSGPWGPHLFFGQDGALIGNGGWKAPRWTAQPNWAMPSPRRAKAGASPPPSCVNWSD